MRYTAHTIDGSLIFSADSAQRIGDKVAEHIKENRKPHIGYTYDNTIPAFPYTVWNQEYSNFVGHQCKNIDEVIARIRKI